FGVFAGALGPYGISKHAVAALTETLYFNLQSLGVTHVGVSVLCPGAVRTNFGTSARNRPAWAGPAGAATEDEQAAAEHFARLSARGAPPAEVPQIVVDGTRAGGFYILTSSTRDASVARRAREILAGAPPAHPFFPGDTHQSPGPPE